MFICYCLGMVLWGKLTSAVSWTDQQLAVSWLWGCPRHPKHWLGHIQNASRHAAHFLHHKPRRKSKGPGWQEGQFSSELHCLHREVSELLSWIWMHLVKNPLLQAHAHILRNPPTTSQRTPKSNYRPWTLTTIHLKYKPRVCLTSSTSENFHSDLLRKIWH